MFAKIKNKGTFMIVVSLLFIIVIIATFAMTRIVRRSINEPYKTKRFTGTKKIAVFLKSEDKNIENVSKDRDYNPFAPEEKIPNSKILSQKSKEDPDNKIIYEPSIKEVILVQ